MRLLLHVDTNDYDNDDFELSAFSLMSLKLKTFQYWRVAGQTACWTIDGEVYCGTAYDCNVKYRSLDGELILRSLVDKIKEICGDRYISLWIDNLRVEFDEEELMLMRPEWIATLQSEEIG